MSKGNRSLEFNVLICFLATNMLISRVQDGSLIPFGVGATRIRLHTAIMSPTPWTRQTRRSPAVHHRINNPLGR